MMTFAMSFNTASHMSSENGRLPIQLRRSLEGEESAENLRVLHPRQKGEL